ncbi:MAG TPA: histidinol-phosphate transaminase [Opitutaceae bacterium]|nr:histidinol-phosphate transaminase [Opitutaceae bacterium]
MTAAEEHILPLVRPEMLALTPYSSARSEAKGGAGPSPRVWLDANENPETPSVGAPLHNRYPEPQPADLVARLAQLYRVAPGNLLVTRGSDEGIDLLLRAFCRAGRDAILITPPTYGMYRVAAAIQDARVDTAPLDARKGFALDAAAVLKAVTPATKIVFLCSPNNPTGALLDRGAVLRLAQKLLGRAVVVVDEAYIEFASGRGTAGGRSLATELRRHPNLIVLRTLSKAYGLAGVRCGATVADPAVIAVLRKIIAPYPIPGPVLEAALAALSPGGLAAAKRSVAALVAGRKQLAAALRKLPAVRRVWPSDANFLLLAVDDAARVMAAARARGVVLRDRSRDVPDTVRITAGAPAENAAVLEVFRSLP